MSPPTGTQKIRARTLARLAACLVNSSASAGLVRSIRYMPLGRRRLLRLIRPLTVRTKPSSAIAFENRTSASANSSSTRTKVLAISNFSASPRKADIHLGLGLGLATTVPSRMQVEVVAHRPSPYSSPRGTLGSARALYSYSLRCRSFVLVLGQVCGSSSAVPDEGGCAGCAEVSAPTGLTASSQAICGPPTARGPFRRAARRSCFARARSCSSCSRRRFEKVAC
jgi:hypothetical protein